MNIPSGERALKHEACAFCLSCFQPAGQRGSHRLSALKNLEINLNRPVKWHLVIMLFLRFYYEVQA